MIYLFGSTGMLGNYVRVKLTKAYEVTCICRDEFDILNDDWQILHSILTNIKKDDVIINCAGCIPQKNNINDYKKFIKINSIFPHKLQELCEKKQAKLIHITTDCVFSGDKGVSYNENDQHTEVNIYGTTKSLGEPENATIIRTSIIGEELKEKKGLLEWVKNNKNNTINGYNNHIWNGVTCLQLSLIINTIVKENLFWNGVRHIYSPNTVSKYDLCVYINEIYNLNINVKNFANEKTINKTLTSIYNPFIDIPDIKTQILLQYLVNNKIHILGKNSFIGKNLYELIKSDNVYTYSHNELDIFKNNISNSDIIINCCGYNNNEYNKLYQANVTFIEEIISIINTFKNIKLVHFSSLQLSELNNNKNDYVDTKQEGEKLIINNLSSNNKYSIMRLCNIYGENHIKPYKNSFINTLIYERNCNIKKRYEIKKNDIYLLNVSTLPEILYNIIPSNDSKVYNIISQQMNLYDVILNLFDKTHISDYFTFVEGSTKKISNVNNIIINNKLINKSIN
tara:strand:+ start:643 stop:2175 length:1533 start_codon:yes stop_codon:yes gene_type:complete